jgi:DNA damage-binding protein 1
MKELQVIDVKFLFGCNKPTIAVLYQDTKEARHVKTYEISVQNKDFSDGPWALSNVDRGACMLIPVPKYGKGV